MDSIFPQSRYLIPGSRAMHVLHLCSSSYLLSRLILFILFPLILDSVYILIDNLLVPWVLSHFRPVDTRS
jgi:hypothetical protein